MNKNLVDIQNVYKGNTDFGIASFSITPENDTPEVLKAYADEYGIANPNWNLLTGDETEIYDVANNGFNIYVAKVDDEIGFEHSGDFALIDKTVSYVRDTMLLEILKYSTKALLVKRKNMMKTAMSKKLQCLKKTLKSC